MSYHILLFLLSFSSVFVTKSSMIDIPVHTKNSYSTFSGPTVSQEFIDTFNPIRCTGLFYKNDDIIILKKEDSNSLIVICHPKRIVNEGNKNNLIQLVANKDSNCIESIISSDRIDWGIASMFKEHVLNDPNNVDKFVSIFGEDNKDKDNFCFFVHNFQIIELTPNEQRIKRNEEIKMVIVELLKMVGTFGCIYLLLSFIQKNYNFSF